MLSLNKNQFLTVPEDSRRESGRAPQFSIPDTEKAISTGTKNFLNER